jgi:hypothetical protein
MHPSDPTFDNRKTAPVSTFNPKDFTDQTNPKFDPMDVSAPSKKRKPFGTSPESSAFAAASANPYGPLDESDAPSSSGSM